MIGIKNAECPAGTKSAQEVIDEEKGYIKDSSRGDDFWGLAISGGGIRSAVFGLGVMQALVASKPKSILQQIDYLSTVSGGSYIGSALTWFLHKELPDGSPAGTEPSNFPFGQIGSGKRTDPRGNVFLDFMRQHVNYLTPGRGLNAISLFGVILRSMFVSLFVYLSLFTIVMVGLRVAQLFETSFNIFGTAFINPLIWLSIIIVVFLALASLVFSLLTCFSSGIRSKSYKRSVAGQKRIGVAWTVVLCLLLIGSLPYVSEGLGEVWRQWAAGLLIFIGVMFGFQEYQKALTSRSVEAVGLISKLVVSIAMLKSSEMAAFLKRMLPTFGAFIAEFALIYGLILSAFILSENLINAWYFVGLVVVTGVLGFFVNLNYVGFHRMYRNRLMETFMPNAQNVIDNQWGRATDADVALLENMCKEKESNKARRPYHLINTNIVLVDSPTAHFRERGGDSFLLSPLYCGSDATGYSPTKDYMKKGSRGITLATAMAISGPAVGRLTGIAGKGVIRDKFASAVLGLLNLRFGYWAPNPKDKRRLPFPPNYFIPGLSDVLGIGLTEQKRTIQLTGGDHFENSALYELIRRKPSVIIASDAGADPNFRFADLLSAMERVRVDFGVKIRFHVDYTTESILPGSATDGPLSKKYELAERGFAIADIIYPDGTPTGTLIYLKATLTKYLPLDIYSYKSANPTFPNQTTSDQFFDETQFEAYRELGYQLTWQMLNSKGGKQILEIADTE